MIKTIKFKMTGTCSLLLHNGQLANPMYPFTKDLKKVSGKRNKTEADHEEMARLEFLGSLYTTDKGTLILPSDVWEGALINGAKKNRLGQQAKAGLFVSNEPVLEYKGAKTGKELWKDKKFVNQVPVKVQRASIIRTRPIFDEWSCKVHVDYNETILNEETVIEIAQIAGEQVGVGDWRPKYGRFSVKVI